MGVTPRDMLEYVVDQELEPGFLCSVMMHKQGYSIAEITDANFIVKDSVCRLQSEAHDLNLKIEDEQICAALRKGAYVSAFLSRFQDVYQVHFFVHSYPAVNKVQFDELIAREVVQYIILRTIIALRLDSRDKIDRYCSNGM